MENTLEEIYGYVLPLEEIYGYVLPDGHKVFEEIFFRDSVTLNMLYVIRQLGWQDASYKNDTCPSLEFTSKYKGSPDITFKLWIDHPDPKEREVDTGFRFTIYKEDKDNDMWEEVPLFESDNPVKTLNYCKFMGGVNK